MLGRLSGYRAANRLRRRILVVLGLGGAAATFAFVRYLRERAHARAHPFSLPEDVDASERPRELVWTGGKARFALDREPPGLLRIRLPDRDVVLADGCDRAQFTVVVDGGATTSLSVISGEIVEESH